MRLLALTVLAAGSLAVADVWAVADRPPKKDRGKEEVQKLDGSWVLVTLQHNGTTFGQDVLKGRRTTIQGGKYSSTLDGKLVVAAVLTLDPSKKPRWLTMRYTGGANKGKTYLGIYDLNRDTLHLCITTDGKTRPKDFSAPKGSNQTYAVFKRVKSTSPK
jgi:uncharacterized protein (TIGR03067 family)